MSKAKLLVAMFIAVLSVSALASASASAELPPAEWMLNGKTLKEEGLTTAALKTEAVTDESAILSAAGTLTITCTGNLKGVEPEIIANNTAMAQALTFSGCNASPATCKVPTTIGTVPIGGEFTLDGPLAVKGILRPLPTGTVFSTILVSGTECSAAGSKAVTGDVEVLAPEGKDERTDQLLSVVQGATGLLKLGSSSASLKGSALILLANSAAWSFL